MEILIASTIGDYYCIDNLIAYKQMFACLLNKCWIKMISDIVQQQSDTQEMWWWGNMTFLWSLLLLMYESMHVAVVVYINYSFFYVYMNITGIKTFTEEWVAEVLELHNQLWTSLAQTIQAQQWGQNLPPFRTFLATLMNLHSKI